MPEATKQLTEGYSKLRPAVSITAMETTLTKDKEEAGGADLYSTVYAHYESADRTKSVSVSVGSARLLNPVFGWCHPDIDYGSVQLLDRGKGLKLKFDIIFEDPELRNATDGRKDMKMSRGYAKINGREFGRDYYASRSSSKFLMGVDSRDLGGLAEGFSRETLDLLDEVMNGEKATWPTRPGPSARRLSPTSHMAGRRTR